MTELPEGERLSCEERLAGLEKQMSGLQSDFDMILDMLTRPSLNHIRFQEQLDEIKEQQPRKTTRPGQGGNLLQLDD